MELWKQLSEDGIFKLENISCTGRSNVQGKDYAFSDGNADCNRILEWHALVRAAIDGGLIESPFSSMDDMDNILRAHISSLISLENEVVIAFDKIRCVIQSGDDNPNDLALCTSYEKPNALPKYRLRFIKDRKELEGKKLISVAFGSSNTMDTLLDRVPIRQAFNTFVKLGLMLDLIEQIEAQRDQWVLLDAEFIAKAFKQLLEDAQEKVEKTEL